PYNTAALASFNTSSDSISLLLINDIGLKRVPFPELKTFVFSTAFIETPSITYNGNELEEIELIPRIRTETPSPKVPPEEPIWTPATLPESACSKLEIGSLASFSPFTEP